MSAGPVSDRENHYAYDLGWLVTFVLAVTIACG
jgi:hypothetical protein